VVPALRHIRRDKTARIRQRSRRGRRNSIRLHGAIASAWSWIRSPARQHGGRLRRLDVDTPADVDDVYLCGGRPPHVAISRPPPAPERRIQRGGCQLIDWPAE
jgi:hypothetical protein